MAFATPEPQTSSKSDSVYKCCFETFGNLVKLACAPLACCWMGPVKLVQQGSVGVMTRYGVLERVLEPGVYTYNIMTQRVQTVSMKMATIEIVKHEAMTKDNLSVQVDAVAFVTVVDATRALFKVEDYRHAVMMLATSTLLRIIAEHDLQQIFTDRARINARLTQTMQDKAAGWGLQVSSVDLRDISIPEGMRRAMAKVAEATREAEAKVVSAKGQEKSAHILAEAAEIMQKQPMSLQLQWFETLREIASEKNSTVIVPDSCLGHGVGSSSMASTLALAASTRG